MTHWDGRTIGDQDREILRMIGEGKQQTEIATRAACAERG